MSDGSSDVCSSDHIGTNVGEMDAVEGDRRHAALILIRNKVDARRCQVAGAQNLFDEIIALIAPIILDAGVDLGAIAAPVRLEIGRVEVRVERIVKRSEEHTSELQSLMRISYAVFCLKKHKTTPTIHS